MLATQLAKVLFQDASNEDSRRVFPASVFQEIVRHLQEVREHVRMNALCEGSKACVAIVLALPFYETVPPVTHTDQLHTLLPKPSQSWCRWHASPQVYECKFKTRSGISERELFPNVELYSRLSKDSGNLNCHLSLGRPMFRQRWLGWQWRVMRRKASRWVNLVVDRRLLVDWH